MTAEGKPIRLVRSIFVPDEETCLLLVDASTVEHVRDTAKRAALPFEHVVETADDVDKKSPASVARQFLQANGLV